MTAITNISLFVKRVELYQTEDYVRQVFTRMGLGEVSTINFIQRIDDAGVHKYNAAIIDFKQWYKSDATSALFTDLRNGTNGTKQVFHSRTKYWFITEYNLNEDDAALTRDNVARNTITTQCSDQDRIQQLEAMVESMAAQLNHVTTDRELKACKITELNDVITKQQITEVNLVEDNDELEVQVNQLQDHIIQQDILIAGTEAAAAEAIAVAESTTDYNYAELNNYIFHLTQVIVDKTKIINSINGINEYDKGVAEELRNKIHSLVATNNDLEYRNKWLIDNPINIDSMGADLHRVFEDDIDDLATSRGISISDGKLTVDDLVTSS